MNMLEGGGKNMARFVDDHNGQEVTDLAPDTKV